MADSLSWTQPICEFCFFLRSPAIIPYRMHQELRDKEICCVCGDETLDGIYTRVDPKEVRYPTLRG